MTIDTLRKPAIPFAIPQSRWDGEAAAGMTEAEALLYRSNLLGSDLTITNFGGGNTSAKIVETDPLTGEAVPVLWVKGSGGDLGSMDSNGFSTLYLDRLRQLERRYRGREHEDEMVELLPHCVFGLNPRAPSIDTPLHTFLEARHIDHVHPDAVIAIAASAGSEDLTCEIYGKRIGWLPWQRPGFDLGLRLRDIARERPELQGVVLEGHGLFSWAETSEACYELTVELIARAASYLNEKLAASHPFGDTRVSPLPQDRAEARLAAVLPALRAATSRDGTLKVGHVDRAPETLEFIGSAELDRLARLGTSCPDHFLRTKIRPLVLQEGDDIDDALAAYRSEYSDYYDRHASSDSPPMRGSEPVIVLLPGVGMIGLAADKATARIATEFYRNAINVMRGAEAVGTYQALPESEAFAIEYWALEEAKLQRRPAPPELTGKIALVTGAAGGIGRAVAAELLRDGACLVLTDIDGERLETATKTLAERFGTDRIATAVIDVTDEQSVAAGLQAAILAFGGVDILVANAGIASAASLGDTDFATWNRNFDVLAKGYFAIARAAFPYMRQMGDGSMVFIGSKNALAASKNASAYGAAKAAALHLARNIALEGAEHGIRVNTVNPDAVLEGSSIWDGTWRKERAEAYGIDPDELEEHYRNRSLLKRAVLPVDIARAVRFFAGEDSSKSTGNILNVDAGNAGAFTR